MVLSFLFTDESYVYVWVFYSNTVYPASCM